MNGQPAAGPLPGKINADRRKSGAESRLLSSADSAATILLDLFGREWRLKRPATLEELWDSATPETFGDDERMPYWAEVWPSSLVLIRWLERMRAEISGRACLDIGCGLGLSATVGAFFGARVLAFDYEPEAAKATGRNAVLNRTLEVFPLVMDWRDPAFKPRCFSRGWAGDILYEQRFARPVAAFLQHCIAPGGVIWLAEPSRTVYLEFLAIMRDFGWRTNKVHQDLAGFIDEQGRELPGPKSTVQIWELTRPKE